MTNQLASLRDILAVIRIMGGKNGPSTQAARTMVADRQHQMAIAREGRNQGR